MPPDFWVPSSLVIKLLPFHNLYFPWYWHARIPGFFNTLVSIPTSNKKNYAVYLNISIYMSMILLSFETLSILLLSRYLFGNLYSLSLGMLVPLESCILLFLYMLTFMSQYLFEIFQLTRPWPPLFPNDPWMIILFCTPVVSREFVTSSFVVLLFLIAFTLLISRSYLGDYAMFAI